MPDSHTSSSSFALYLILLISSVITTTTTTTTLSLTHPQDIAALKAFKSSIDPSSIPNWSCLASWDFSASDPCTVPARTHFLCGLTCGPDSRVESITLDAVGYTGTLSPLISNLAHLTNLDLSNNRFHGPIPFASLTSLTRLQSLSLAGNSFSGPISPSVGKLTGSLQTLDLSRNHLSGQVPNSFSSLSGLTRLDLSNNKLTGSIPNLPASLIELIIRSNSLSGPVLQPAFSKSDQLEVVDLSANSLSDTLPSWMFTLPSLQQLNLSNNTLTRLDVPVPVPGRHGGRLVSVDLGFNRITGYVSVNFSRYPSLWALSLRYNQLRGRIPAEFGQKGSSLKRLFLDGNFLIGRVPAGMLSVDAGSFGDNCLTECPKKSALCGASQKPAGVCSEAYRGRKKRKPKPTAAIRS